MSDLGASQNKLLFFGPETPAPQPTQPSQPQFRRCSRFVQKFDIAVVRTDGSLTLRGVALEVLLQTTARLVNTGSTVDLQTQLGVVTLYPRAPLVFVQIGDIILLNSGARTENPPTSCRLRVEGFHEIGAMGLRRSNVSESQIARYREYQLLSNRLKRSVILWQIY